MSISGTLHSIGLGARWIAVAALSLLASPALGDPAPGTLLLTHSGAVLTVDPATGDRTELSGASVGSGTSFSLRPVDIVREESGDFVVSDFDVEALIRVDGDTGDRTVLASSVVGAGGPFRPSALEIDGNDWLTPANEGTLLVWNTNAAAIERVDPVSGDRTVVASASVGSGPALSAVQDMLRFGPGAYLTDYDLAVTDSNLAALVIVRTFTGERVVLSSASRGSGPNFITPRGIAMVFSISEAVYYVVDSGLDAVVSVSATDGVGGFGGDRTIVSSGSVGSGPDFDFPYNIWPSPDGSLYVSDLGLDAVFHVDPATGDRTIVSDAVTGGGPAIGGPRGFTAVPAPAFAWGFEGDALGAPPAYTALSPGLVAGSVTVERADSFVGGPPAPEGKNVLYLTTGPGDRGDPASVGGQSDQSYLILPFYRGQNAPRRLRFVVDRLTAEGAQPDPSEVVAIRFGSSGSTVRLDLLSMQTVNPSPPVFGGGTFTALTAFTGGPITGPDGSVFDKGHNGFVEYELDVDFPGVLLGLRVADQGDGTRDTAMLLDDAYILPEPGLVASLAAGCGLLSGLRRRGSRRESWRSSER